MPTYGKKTRNIHTQAPNDTLIWFTTFTVALTACRAVDSPTNGSSGTGRAVLKNTNGTRLLGGGEEEEEGVAGWGGLFRSRPIERCMDVGVGVFVLFSVSCVCMFFWFCV